MPAVSSTRLQAHLNSLAATFDSPQVFVSNLRDILDLYADKTFHPGEQSPQEMHLLRYFTPPLLMKQLELEFRRLAETRPQEALANAELLWQEKHFESRVLAADLLGWLPAEFDQQTMALLDQWLKSKIEPALKDVVLTRASLGQRRHNPDAWFELIHTWLEEPDFLVRARGVDALRITALDEHFDNLPLILRYADPLFNAPSVHLLPELGDLYGVLVQRFPGEMLVYTRELMKDVADPRKEKLLRRVITFFDAGTARRCASRCRPLCW